MGLNDALNRTETCSELCRCSGHNTALNGSVFRLKTPLIVVIINYNKDMRIGQFFSLQQGRVGQYLSPRVLVVRTPFRPVAAQTNLSYFGFDDVSQAQKFARQLAALGYRFQVRRSRVMPQPYEVRLSEQLPLARTLAYWDRRDDRRLGQGVSTGAAFGSATGSVPAGRAAKSPLAA